MTLAVCKKNKCEYLSGCRPGKCRLWYCDYWGRRLSSVALCPKQSKEVMSLKNNSMSYDRR